MCQLAAAGHHHPVRMLGNLAQPTQLRFINSTISTVCRSEKFWDGWSELTEQVTKSGASLAPICGLARISMKKANMPATASSTRKQYQNSQEPPHCCEGFKIKRSSICATRQLRRVRMSGNDCGRK